MNCKEGNFGLLGQVMDTLSHFEGEDYREPLGIFNGSSIGQHYRHIYDFYNCLLKGIEQGIIDYGDRERYPRIELEPQFALSVFAKLTVQMNSLNETDAVEVRADFSAEPGIERPLVRSTIGRELMFAFDHTIHHLAMINIGILSAFPHLGTRENLGVAPSTIKHWSGQRAEKE